MLQRFQTQTLEQDVEHLISLWGTIRDRSNKAKTGEMAGYVTSCVLSTVFLHFSNNFNCVDIVLIV